jgi:hypothetical protein
MRSILEPLSQRLSIRVLGTELDNLLPRAIPLPRLLRWMPRFGIKAWARRWGWSLWIEGEKQLGPESEEVAAPERAAR